MAKVSRLRAGSPLGSHDCARASIERIDARTGVLSISLADGEDPIEAEVLDNAFAGLPPRVGDEVLALDSGGREPPLIVGRIASRPSHRNVGVMLDGRSLVFEAQQEIVLNCGRASIVLTEDGRVVIRGAKIVSRASGVNKLKGGSVQIN